MRRCSNARTLMARRAAGDLDPSENAQLEGHLAACPGCREEAEVLSGFTKGLTALEAAAVRPRASARMRVLNRLRQETLAKKAGQPVGPRVSTRHKSVRRISSRRFRRPARFGLGLALAASVLLAVAAFFALRGRKDARPGPAGTGTGLPVAVTQPDRPALALVRSTGGQPRLVRAGRAAAVAAGSELLAGDRLETDEGSRIRLRYPDGSALELNRNTVVRLAEEGGAKRLVLERGEIFARIARQPAGRPLVINPDRADQVTVVGTAFELVRRESGTRLRMVEGRVEFGSGGAAVAVSEGEASSVEDGQLPAPPVRIDPDSVATWRLGTPSPEAAPAAPEAPEAPAAPPVPTTQILPPSQPILPVQAPPPPAVPPAVIPGQGEPPAAPVPAPGKVPEGDPQVPPKGPAPTEAPVSPEDPPKLQDDKDKDKDKDKVKEDNGKGPPPKPQPPKGPSKPPGKPVGTPGKPTK